MDGTGGVTEFGRDQPAAVELDDDAAVSLVVTRRECEGVDWGVGRADERKKNVGQTHNEVNKNTMTKYQPIVPFCLALEVENV